MNPRKFRSLACDLYLEANYKLRPDVKRALSRAYLRERSQLARQAIKIILENARLASKDKIALCQDTGYPIFFIKLGRAYLAMLPQIERELTLGIKDATLKGPLRSSLVLDPLRRKGISPNLPPIFHIEFSSRKHIEITLLVKGFGSENQSRLCLLSPNASQKEIVEKVVAQVRRAGSRACPPYIIGLGIGGTAEKALELSKKALLLDVDKRSKEPELALLEKKIEKEVNKLGIGALGVGGRTTTLGVRILTHPTHIAGLPLGISLGCHSTRSATRRL